jgi:vancomycin resistance protein YoaR
MGSEEKDLKDIQKVSGGKKAAIIAGCIVGVLAVVYVGLGVFFQSHFYFRSTVNGVNASAASLDTVKSRIRKQADDYQLTLVENGGKTETIGSSEVGLTVDLESGAIDRLLEGQNGFLWGGHLFVPVEYVSESLVSVNPSAVAQTVAGLDCTNDKNATKTQNATYQMKNDVFSVKEEVYGTEVDKKALTKNVADAMVSLQDTLDLEESASYVQPTVLSDNEELNDLIDRLNDIVKVKFTYTIGSKNVTLSADEIASWLQINDDLEIAFDEEAMAEYIDGLAKEVNTAGTKRSLVTQHGTTVTLAPGNYGWRVDKEGELAQLEEDLLGGKDVSRDLVYSTTAHSHDGNDYGDSYVEVDMSAQHVWLIMHGQVVAESDCVTGDVSRNRLTPVGAFRITYCEKDAILKGENYRTHVNYWMPFAGDCGLHDATWRRGFGGDIYLTDGSHGCVNLPLSMAKTIFSNVETGFPVLVYGGLTTMPMSEEEAAARVDEVVGAINAIGDPNSITPDNVAILQNAITLFYALPEQYRGNVGNQDIMHQAVDHYRATYDAHAFY